MKYSLKNREFKKRNNIFGDRRREDDYQQNPNAVIVESIREAFQQQQESQGNAHLSRQKNKDKVYKFIDFEGNAKEARASPAKNHLRKQSNENRQGRHGLSPVKKPLLTNLDIRLAQSARYFNSFQISSGIISVCISPQRPASSTSSSSLPQIKAILHKLASILFKNNSRIDQLQQIVSSILNRGQLIAKQITQGMKTALKMQEQTDLFFNTMRSVYQNLRICKLKQENLELYFKQEQGHDKRESNHHQQYLEHNDRTVKYSNRKYSLASKHYEEPLQREEEKQSRELAKLVDYQSDVSYQDLNFSSDSVQDHFYDEPVNGFKRKLLNTQEEYQLDKLSYRREERSPAISEYQQLSPFEANKMISNSSHNTLHHSNYSYPKSPSHHLDSYNLQTFRSKTPQSQQDKVYSWIQRTKQKGLKCWLDDMGCLRRQNNTYIFDEHGNVITMSQGVFWIMVEERILESVRDV